MHVVPQGGAPKKGVCNLHTLLTFRLYYLPNIVFWQGVKFNQSKVNYI